VEYNRLCSGTGTMRRLDGGQGEAWFQYLGAAGLGIGGGVVLWIKK